MKIAAAQTGSLESPAKVEADCCGHNEKADDYDCENYHFTIVFDESHCLFSSLAKLD